MSKTPSGPPPPEPPSTAPPPPKYALLSCDRRAEYEGEPGYEEPWGTCTDVTGLLAKAPTPSRETYTLLGSAPDGPLREAVARARTDGSAPLGALTLEILDRRGRAVGEWWLEDVRVLTARPCARDLSLTDITVEGTPAEDNPCDYPQCPPLSPGYRALSPTGEPYGTCRDLARTPTPPPEPQPPPVHLLGCSPRGTLRSTLNGTAKQNGTAGLGEAKLLRIDTSGRPVQSAAEGRLLSWTPSALAPDLVDLLFDPGADRPPLVAEQVWRLWSDGRPAEPGRWAECTTEARHFWLETALSNHNHNQAHPHPDHPTPTTYHLDGRHITDVPGFFCALGEAVNGPGGYFGWGQDALIDCLRGDWGTPPGFTLVWHHSATARTCLGVTPYAHPRTATFEELLALLAQSGAAVHLT
ncbi:barstar family protein [Streptomyces sp. NPDC093252]|uniref:barstar family protein n=1 Tax=Streptomyces sp. NPDC093252 TaxID=3154980 RepID=UPI0034128B0F